MLARVPLASGFLTGKFQASATFPANDMRSTIAPEKVQKMIAEARVIQRDEVPPGVAMAQWALAWCLKNPLVTSVIPGCKDPNQTRFNAAAAELVL